MKIAFCSSEAVPFAKTGGLADVCGTLPLSLEKLGHEMIIFLPYYQCAREFGLDTVRVHNEVLLARLGKDIKVYLIENEKYFDRSGLYGDDDGDYPDNLERFSFFCLKVLELIKRFHPDLDIVHCHDWQTALIPAYLAFKFYFDEDLRKVMTIFTIHNLAYQGVFPAKELPKLDLPRSVLTPEGIEFYGKINLLKAGIIYSRMVTTVSENYAKEIQTTEFGCGLEGVLKNRREGIVGILNGIDQSIWNPATDSLIAKNYDGYDPSAKQHNKKNLRAIFNLPDEQDLPIFGFVGRLSHQKGLDLILESLVSGEATKNIRCQMVFLGLGNKTYIKELKKWANQCPRQVAVCFEFSEKTAHQIYAGSDFFLMPSVFEPCGLSQMISLRYGTIPVVHAVGGLKDTIQDVKAKGNGIVFEEHSVKGLTSALQRAIKIYQQKELFQRLVKKAARYDFSWERSAQKYEQLYASLTVRQKRM